jgi:uncharacterized protein YciI
MSMPRMTWPETVTWAEEHGLLAMQLFLVQSIPTGGLGPVMDNLDPHVGYQVQLEQDGIMFAAGPLADDEVSEWKGEGMFIYRASSREEAIKLAEQDPMHISGARRFTVRSWLMNEGGFNIRVFFSAGRSQVS